MKWSLTVSQWQRRTTKFSVVGAMGIGVQLVALATLTRLKVNYLLATCLAVESAILHNFFWHQRFTWRDRATQREFERFGRLVRFHVSNGLISLFGNLVMMRLLVGRFGLPIMAANGVSIAVCCVANFMASDRWVFSLPRPDTDMPEDPAGSEGVNSSSCDRASAPMCARRKAHTAGQPWPPAPARGRFAVQVETVTGPRARPG